MEKQIYKAPEGSKIVSVTTEENRVVIEYEKEVFEPKDGDFVAGQEYHEISVAIYQLAKTEANGFYFHAAIRGVLVFSDWANVRYANRLATESEKQQLLDAIAKDGKRWNAEKKCIEKVRERAKRNHGYWSALNLGKFEPASVLDTYDDMDNGRYESGNYFLTESDCQRLCDQLNNVVSNFE